MLKRVAQRRNGWRVGLGMLVVAAVAGAAAGEAMAPADIVTALFGEEIATARATATPDDNVRLAEQMTQVASYSMGAPEMALAICQEAHDLVADVSGQEDVAARALETMAAVAPDQAVAAFGQLTALRRKQMNLSEGDGRQAAAAALLDATLSLAKAHMRKDQWSEATQALRDAQELANSALPHRKDEVNAMLTGIADRRDAQREITELQRQLEADPNNPPARRRLVSLLLVEMDDPQGAGRRLGSLDDEILQTYLPLAVLEATAMSPSVALEVGQWYRYLASQREGLTRQLMLRRAERFLTAALAGNGVGVRQQAQAALDDIVGGLTSGESAVLTAASNELLALVDLSIDVSEGTWRPGTLGSTAEASKQSRLVLPVVVEGGYELQISLARVEGEGPAYVILPLATRSVVLVIDAGGITGLSQVSGQGIQEGNPSCTQGRGLLKGRPLLITVDVAISDGDVSVNVSAPNGLETSWRGLESELRMPPGLPPIARGRIAVGSFSSSMAFKTISLRTKGGQAKRVRPD